MLAVLLGVLFLANRAPRGAGSPSAPATSPSASAGASAVPRLHAEVLARLPHDTTAFTQGLEIADGKLYEGTGRNGQSALRVLDPANGNLLSSVPVPDAMFGEGITVVGPRLWQLTWQEGVAIDWDRASLTERRRVRYDGEGWGLCLDRDHGRLVMSDGSDRLALRDPTSFATQGELRVQLGGQPVTRLNELECAGGWVWANVWQTDQIVRIDPETGAVTAVVDLAALHPPGHGGDDVLNGIAAVPGTDDFLVTGKDWPTLYRVRFTP